MKTDLQTDYILCHVYTACAIAMPQFGDGLDALARVIVIGIAVAWFASARAKARA